MEKHYTLAELAEAWHLDIETIRPWFLNEPGVLRQGGSSLLGKGKKRAYVSLRIPESVAKRVYERKTQSRIKQLAR